MQRSASVYNQDKLCGYLSKTEEGHYIFQYEEQYALDPTSYPVSLTLPKRIEAYYSNHLFAFFYGLLAEGVNKKTQCRLLHIDENDHFSLLLKTAKKDTIGAVTIKEKPL